MCFSATASFTAAAVLVTTGASALALNREPKARAFAAIPVLFGAQQFLEGWVWVSFAGEAAWRLWPVVGFLFFAWALWPVWAPWSIARMETEPRRRKILWALTGLGVLFAALAVHALATGEPYARLNERCVDYGLRGYGANFIPPNLQALIYFAAVVASFFVSSRPWVRRTGFLILGGLALTMAFWKFAVTSVWCFFAALASLSIWAHFFREYADSRAIRDFWPRHHEI